MSKKFLELVADKEDLELYCSERNSDGYDIELEYWSDLGEDVLIPLAVNELTEEEIIHAMYECVESFDAEEHATNLYNLHGAGGTPTSLRDLLTDADEQQEKFKQIYKTMLELHKYKIAR